MLRELHCNSIFSAYDFNLYLGNTENMKFQKYSDNIIISDLKPLIFILLLFI